MDVMISCKEATMLMEQKLAQKLTFKERLNLKIHRFLCNACNQYGIQSEWIDGVVKSLSSKEKLTKQEKERIKEQLH